MMMSLGMFIFSLPTLAYQDLARRTDWRFSTTSRVGARAASQGVGPGEDRITLTGVLLPDVAGDMASIDTLRRMGDTLDAHRLVDGLGRQLGDWVIDSIDETQSNFFEDGVARKTDFKLDIHRVDDPVDYTALFS